MSSVSSSSSFHNQVALITGGTSGIGQATALALAAAGAKVVLSGRREAEGLAIVAAIEKAGGTAAFFRADSSRDEDNAALVRFTVEKFGRLTLAFNNAGVESTGPLTSITHDDYRRVFDLNVWGVMSAMKHEIPALLAAGGGSIVNTSSAVGHVGMGNVSTYVASKHAVEGLTKAVALEYARQNIRVNTIAPAAIETEMLNRFADSPEKREYMANMHPVGRVGHVGDIARGVLFLLDPSNTFVTGTSLKVDGGFLAQ